MDGTLIDSKKDITISVNYVRKHNHSLPPLLEEFIVNAINKKERNLAYLFYKTQTYEERDRELFEKHYKEQCIENPYLYDGIEEVLHTLKDAGVCLGVATNAPTPFAKTMLEHLGVAHLFSRIIGADEAKSKPEPDMVYAILESCKYVKGDRAWMIGDNPKDIEVAHRAHIDAIYAKWGFQSDFSYNVEAQKPHDILKIIL